MGESHGVPHRPGAAVEMSKDRRRESLRELQGVVRAVSGHVAG